MPAMRIVRPRCSALSPFAVACTWSTRASRRSATFRATPFRSISLTSRLIVGARTCSAAASSPSVFGPDMSTESADSCAGETPVSGSVRRARRSRWIAAECSRSASSVLGVRVAGRRIG